MGLFKNCANCEHSCCRECYWWCGVNGREINYPHLSGGPKKCECWQKIVRVKEKFPYPKLSELAAKENK